MSAEDGRHRGGRPKGFAIDGDAVRGLRRALGLTQAELAERTGLTARTAQSAEASARVAPSTARMLAAVLGVSLDALRRRAAISPRPGEAADPAADP